MTCGIYRLIFKGTTKVYIGQSINIENRYKRHIYLMEKGTSTPPLQCAYPQYGTPELDILAECTCLELSMNEKESIDIWDSYNNGFNSLDRPGISGSTSSSEHHNCNYTKEQLVQAFKLIVSSEFLKFEDISKITGVSISAIRHISSLESNFWLAEEFPEEYDILYYRKVNKVSRISAAARGIEYPTIYSPEGIAYTITNMCQFAKEHNLQQANLSNVLHGKNKTIKGWHL